MNEYKRNDAAEIIINNIIIETKVTGFSELLNKKFLYKSQSY